MDKKKTALLLELSDTNDGYVSVAEAKGYGIAQTYLCSAEEEGLFLKVSKGLYIKKGYARDPFYELTFRYHKVVFSLESCLFLHGLKPEQTMTVHLPSNYLTQGIDGIFCRHVGNKEYQLGQSLVVTPWGNLVNAYDLERTLIDLLRAHNAFDKEEFLSLWRLGKEKSPYQEKLRAYAEAFHVSGELSLMEQLY